MDLKDLEGSGNVLITVLSQNLPGGTDEGHDERQPE
jgi:hypothetical protein